MASEGLLAMATAASVAIAISSGVILGEYVAQPLKREARRVESRLAGPRLVGPLRVRTGRAAAPGAPRHGVRGARGRLRRAEASRASQACALPSYGARPAVRAACTRSHESIASRATSSG